MRWRLDPGQIEVVDEDVAAVLRTMSLPQRLAIVEDANRIGRLMIADEVRQLHPDWSEELVRREVARRFMDGQISDDLVRHASDAAMRNATGLPVGCRDSGGCTV